MIRYPIIVLLFIGSSLNSYGQSKTEKQLIVRGRVVDTVEQQPIASATVSIYQKHGKLLKYGFTNNRGIFNLVEVPLVDSVFQVRVSYIGYSTVKMVVNRSLTSGDIQIGDIQIKSSSNLIEEVHVNRPPILMDRDTLVINPEAFDLQPNAVVEDLLTKVPGIVIWGDGMITVNGKKVDKVLVEGQSFFGQNPAIATRNLPADAIDKVKIYNNPRNMLNQEESLEMNIILKNGNKNGVFGKASIGEGTKNRKERTFLINVFDPQNQISLFAGSNNTNKIVRNTSDFLSANVYKAGGENLESNTPKFDQRGNNDFLIAGFKFDRKWNDRLKTNLELLHDTKNSEMLTDVFEIRLLGEGAGQEILENRVDKMRDIRQSYLGSTRYADTRWELRINSRIQQSKTSRDQLYNRQIIDKSDQSLFELHKGMHDEEQNRTGKVGFNLRQVNMLAPIKFNMSYEFETESRTQHKQENILFTNNDPIDRLKQNTQGGSLHEMDATIGLNGLLNGMDVKHIGLSLDLRNTLKVHQLNEEQRDFFLNPATDTYTTPNQAISYADRLREIMWTPEITVSKGFNKQTARGRNSWSFCSAVGLETSSRKNTSDHELRVLDQQMLFILPSASARYVRTRQLSGKSMALDFKSLINHPHVPQLIALLDTTQRDFNQIGNKNLKPEEEYRFSIEYSDMRFAKKLHQRLRFTYSLYRNQHVNSSTYSPDGERLSRMLNAAGLPSFGIIYEYRMSKQLWDRPLDINLISQLNGRQRYFFNNDVRHKNSRVMMNHHPEIHYAVSDWFKMGVLGSYSTSWSYSGLNNMRTNSFSVGLDAVLTWPRRITWISRFVSFTNRFSSMDIPADHRYLWNIDVYYRMLKKEQLEIKFSAYDVLNNNKTIQNILRDNIVRQVRVNNIMQFFMIGLSYYPRFF